MTGTPPPSPTVSLDLDLTQQISPPAAPRQYSLVMPSLAPDKTSVRDTQPQTTRQGCM